MTIQIEEGKFYKRADGSVHGPATALPPSGTYPWRVGGNTYGSDGSFYGDGVYHRFSLVAEVPNPDQHAAETVEGKPDVEDDGFITRDTRDTPEWAAAVEQEAAEERRPFAVGDEVTNIDVPDAGVGKVIEIIDAETVRVDYSTTWYKICRDETRMLRLSEPAPADPLLRAMLEDDIVRSDPNDMADAMGLAWTGGFVGVDLAEEPDIKTIIADEAKRIVSGARRSAYGKPEANFERIARFWQAYFENTGRADIKVTAADVSPLMRLMKEARLAESPNHYDSFVDLIGYTLTGAEVNQVQKPA